MSLMKFMTGGLIIFVVVGVLAVQASPVQARLSIEDRLAERRAQRAERDAQRVIDRAARDAERAERHNVDQNDNDVDADNIDEETEEEVCNCTARLSYDRPALQWRGGTLAFIPRVNLDIRTRGERSAPNWFVGLEYEGEASYSSEDVIGPTGITFSGRRDVVGGQCGDNRYSYTGLRLPDVNLAGLVRGLVGIDQELDGVVRMRTRVVGCGADTEYRQFRFEVEEFDNLDVGRWRRVR